MTAVRSPSQRFGNSPSSTASALERMRLGFSPNYEGDLSAKNASKRLPDELNCVFFLKNLPPDVTHREILAAIRKMGRVFALFINRPEASQPAHHKTCAAKLQFFDLDAAQRFWNATRARQLYVRDYPITVLHNRNSEGQSGLAPHITRCIRIIGPASSLGFEIINAEWLIQYFQTKCHFDIDRVEEMISEDGRPVVEFHFGSYRSQAASAFDAIRRELWRADVQVEFVTDPCSLS
jgi:hypothetical protein